MSSRNVLLIAGISMLVLTLPFSVSAEQPQERNQFSDKKEALIKQFRFDMKSATMEAKRKEMLDSFKEQRAKLLDERKKLVLERLETKLASVTAKRQEHMLETHARLTTVYTKLAEKEQRLKAAGADTASATAALALAKTSLDKAHASISAHRATSYTLDTTDEQNLKFGVQTLLKKIHTDFKEDQRLLKEAKEALKKAARILRDIDHETLKKGATNGPTPATTSAI